MNTESQKKIKAVGLLSGGLDSIIAAKVVKDLGVDVYGVYFAMPWGCCDKKKATEASQVIGINFIVLQLDERYLEMVKKPEHGYGTAMNPCVDCRIHMFSRAAQYMKHIGAEFVFTGEVLGQRPMSQMKHSMRWIEKGANLEGRLLRPLSAQLLDPTIPEQEGTIDRQKLLNISGRSRKEQIRIVTEMGIDAYNQPAGGCLLTDKNFARRMKDTLDHGYRNFRETIALQWGRHFRIDENFKAIMGRNAEENETLLKYSHQDDFVMVLKDKPGATLLLKGYDPSQQTLSTAAGLLQRFSKFKNEDNIEANYWTIKDQNTIHSVESTKLAEEQVKKMYL